MPPAVRNGARNVRSEFLKSRLGSWMEAASASGKAAELLELEMWLRSLERFFRIRNQPISDREAQQLALRNWTEELRLVDNVVVRVTKLCVSIARDEGLDKARFGRFVEGAIAMKRGEPGEAAVPLFARQTTPEAGLVQLRESFDDIHTLLANLVRLSQLPYAAFASVGRLVDRETRRHPLIALLIEQKWKPIHDRITNRVLATTIRGILSASDRKNAARVFLELFRLLRYLEFADPRHLAEADLKNTVLVFALVTAETRQLLANIERRIMGTLAKEDPLYGVYDAFIYSMPLELRKVLQTELLDIASFRHAQTVRARVENSHGILKACFQQSIVQLAQAFDPKASGGEIFPDFVTRREESVALAESLRELVAILRAFEVRRDPAEVPALKTAVSAFYDTRMTRLMYRDWAGFEQFYIELLKCASLPALVQIAHRFGAFLETLRREVSKRAVLNDPAA